MNDNNNDKPFVCTEKGCQMKFSNIDHLSVHQKRHEMKLKFSGLSSGLSSSGFAIADQTPTPSRILGNFLQNWEAVGLNTEIQEITNLTPFLNDTTTHSKTAEDTNSCNSKSSSVNNPFAQSFSNALKGNHLKAPEMSARIVTTTSDSPLNTPSIFPNEGLMAIVNAALNTPDPDFHFSHNHKDIETNESNTNSQTLESLVNDVTNGSAVTANDSAITSNHKSAQITTTIQTIPLKNDLKGQRFQAVPVIRTANTNLKNISISQTIPNIVISQTNNKTIKTLNTTKLRTVSIAQNAKTNAIIAPKSEKSSITLTNSNNNSLYKVILKLPDGRSVQLPLIQQPLTPTSIQPTFTAINSSVKTDEINAIKSAELTIGSLTGSSSHANQTSSTTSLSALQSKVDATLASLPPKAKPGRKSKFAPEEDPREKKARSLERNRAAAMRCRLKRKHWIDSLEEKADEYEKINEKLQSEVVSLRREVTLLKTALLSHKDCPVTLQQQKSTNDVITFVTTNGSTDRLDNNIETNGLT